MPASFATEGSGSIVGPESVRVAASCPFGFLCDPRCVQPFHSTAPTRPGGLARFFPKTQGLHRRSSEHGSRNFPPLPAI